MASRLAPLPLPTASTEVTVFAGTAIGTVAQLLRQRGAQVAEVVDPKGERTGVALAQDVIEADRLGASREPISRIVVWSGSTPAVRSLPSPPLRLVRSRRREDATATRTAPVHLTQDMAVAATDAPEPLLLLQLRRA